MRRRFPQVAASWEPLSSREFKSKWSAALYMVVLFAFATGLVSGQRSVNDLSVLQRSGDRSITLNQSLNLLSLLYRPYTHREASSVEKENFVNNSNGFRRLLDAVGTNLERGGGTDEVEGGTQDEVMMRSDEDRHGIDYAPQVMHIRR